MRIAVDIDGTLAQTHEVFLEELERREGVSHELEDLQSWEFENVDFSVEKFHRIARENWRKRDIPLTEQDIPEHLRALREHASRIDVVTARDDIPKSELRDWLNSKNVPFDSLKVSNEKTSMKYDYLIDDSPNYLRSEMKVLLYHRPYNRHAELGGKDKRLRSFSKIVKHMESLQN